MLFLRSITGHRITDQNRIKRRAVNTATATSGKKLNTGVAAAS